MTSDFENATTEELITHIVARDVAYGVEMARSIGYGMPVEYDVGFSRRVERRGHKGTDMRITLRMNDAKHDVLVFVPYLDERSTMREVDVKWTEMMHKIRSASLTVAHVWIDLHPEANPPKERIAEALAKLDALTRSDLAESTWTEAVRRKAQAARFERVR